MMMRGGHLVTKGHNIITRKPSSKIVSSSLREKCNKCPAKKSQTTCLSRATCPLYDGLRRWKSRYGLGGTTTLENGTAFNLIHDNQQLRDDTTTTLYGYITISPGVLSLAWFPLFSGFGFWGLRS